MTDQEISAARLLSRCTFPPASNQKRFAHQCYANTIGNPELVLTEKQSKYLLGLAWSYRRQIGVAELARIGVCEKNRMETK